jgi:hypothetical protein
LFAFGNASERLAVADRLLLDLEGNGEVTVQWWPEGATPQMVAQQRLEWPLDAAALEDLRWYLEDYLRAPFGVYEDRGPQVEARLPEWGNMVFASRPPWTSEPAAAAAMPPTAGMAWRA